MIPVYISGCFAWLHQGPLKARRGVVLCGALGNEACNVHRPWIVLAELLAARGLPTLRFDYPGAGDSMQDDDRPIGLADWTRSIADAAAWLKRTAGVEEICLCGLRAGAALAALAAPAIDGVDALVLLAPVVSGRTYVRELVISARAWDSMWVVEQATEADGWFEAAGLRVTGATKQELQTVDLRKLSASPARRILIMDSSATVPVQAVAHDLAALGAAVDQRPFPGQEQLFRDALENEVPRTAFATVADWLAEGDNAITAPIAAAQTVAPPMLDLDGVLETPVHFGAGDRAFGIYCTPAAVRPPLSVLILNTGAHPHHGHSRIAVSFARKLSRLGVASLRIDAAGIGDADLATGEKAEVYSSATLQDARAALDWLREAGNDHVIALGICSGAYDALHMAVTDRSVRGLVLVNLQKYIWQPGIPLRVVQRNTFRPTQFYLHHIRTSRIWRRLLRGEVNVSGISRALAGRVARRLRSSMDPWLSAVGPQSRFARVRGWFRDLHQHRTPVLYVLSFNDPGLDELEEYFGAHGRRLSRYPRVQLAVLGNADHTLTHRRTRDELFRLIEDWLKAEIGAWPEVAGRPVALAGAKEGYSS